MRARLTSKTRIRLVIACIVTAALLGPLAWFWQASLLPGSYSVMDMGYVDMGGAAPPATHTGGNHPHGTTERDITSLVVDPNRPADVTVALTAREERFRLASGRTVAGYTLNGVSPGPAIHATVGQLVQVRLVNESVTGDITLHWHGVNVPGAVDGVAGVTQDAVRMGAEHVYRFIADQAGTFWYHSHQVSHIQVAGGLLGPLVISPASPSQDATTSPDAATPQDAATSPNVVESLALSHIYQGIRTVNGLEGDIRVDATPGQRARVRVINTDNGTLSTWVAGAPFHLVAIDGTDTHDPPPVSDRRVDIAAGSRADVEVIMPADGSPVRVHVGGPNGIVLGSTPQEPPRTPQPKHALDPLSYGTPTAPGFDPGAPDRTFRYDIGRRPGFVAGRPGVHWTINGHLYPNVPMFLVADGDVVRMRVSNHSGEIHPMHLHGHHALILSRDGVPATGSPWWVDSFDVADGESYEIAFVANNPGIWLDHCHNLPHAADGMVAHLMYEGVTTPFVIGGTAHNEPE